MFLWWPSFKIQLKKKHGRWQGGVGGLWGGGGGGCGQGYKIYTKVLEQWTWLKLQQYVCKSVCSGERYRTIMVLLFTAKTAEFLDADNKASDQIAWVCRLIGVFIGDTCHEVHFLMLHLKAITPDKALFSSEEVLIFSYFSIKLYVVVLIKSASAKHF